MTARAAAAATRVRPDANGNVPVAGLLVPAPLVPRIVSGVRRLYPALAEGKDDDAAVRAWLKHMVTGLLAQAEVAATLEPLDQALDDTRADYEARAEAARAKATADAALIVEAPPPVVTPPAGDTPPAPTDPA